MQTAKEFAFLVVGHFIADYVPETWGLQIDYTRFGKLRQCLLTVASQWLVQLKQSGGGNDRDGTFCQHTLWQLIGSNANAAAALATAKNKKEQQQGWMEWLGFGMPAATPAAKQQHESKNKITFLGCNNYNKNYNINYN